MAENIAFAGPADEEELKGLLTGTGMDLAGDVTEHVVLRQGDRILAGARLFQVDDELFHLMVFAVAAAERGRGTGRAFLRELGACPWAYCREALPVGGPYRVTTVAKGTAAGFYNQVGYRECGFAQLPAPFDEQCAICPDREQCSPVPMVFCSDADEGCLRGQGR